MKDFEIGSTEQSSGLSDIESRMLESYQATVDADSQIDTIEDTIAELESSDIDVCDSSDLIEKLNSVKEALSSVAETMSGRITSALTNAMMIQPSDGVSGNNSETVPAHQVQD